MSTVTPPPSLPVVDRQPELIGQLLTQQSDLSAVEQFSQWHEEHGESPLGPAQEKYYRNLLPASAPSEGQQLAFEVDLDACSGCKACVVACHTLNGLEEDESWRRVGTLMTGGLSNEPAASPETPAASPESLVTLPAIQHVTTACHHCEDPGCLNGCPVRAYDKDPVTGIVRHLDDQCIGCKYCTMMCPYEVPQYSDRLGIVRKCDMCHQRLSVGEAPACVQSCPNEAIKIRVVDIESGTVNECERLVPGAPSSSITIPTTTYVSNQSAKVSSGVPQDFGVDHVAESHWPLAVLLVTSQIAVGLLILEFLTSSLASASGFSLPGLFTPVAATIALLLAGAGLSIAPLHLGQPTRAWRVFLGLRTSWLSREGVVLGKFSGLLGAAVALLWLPSVSAWLPSSVAGLDMAGLIERIPAWLPRALLAASIVFGLAGIYCSAMIYIATRRQLWRSQRTLPRFFGSVVVGGFALATPLFAWFGLTTALILSSLAMLAVMAFKLVWEWNSHLNPQGLGDSYDRRSRVLVWDRLATLAICRLGLGLTVIALAFSAPAAWILPMPVVITLTSVLAFAVVAGELAERLLYFTSVVHDRMPGTL